MRRKHWLPLLLLLVLLVGISLPSSISDQMRAVAMVVPSPFWQMMTKLKQLLYAPFQVFDPFALENEKQQLALENLQLQTQLSELQKLFCEMMSLNSKSLAGKEVAEASFQSNDRRRSLIQLRAAAQPAKVIYRSPHAWSSSLWIDQGENTNVETGQKRITVNSPVTLGNALVGVIDYVGRYQSRVRLITDAGLSISVRAARGQPQKQHLSESIDLLMMHLRERHEFFASVQEQKKFALQLRGLQRALKGGASTVLLAKGELHGSSLPLWRSKGQQLKGVGFNYDFADEAGPARDLRTGIPYGAGTSGEAVSLLNVGDLLITTGMDGIFPPDLPVAEVTEIAELEEGDYTYELKARSIIPDLNELSLLFVLPPVGFDANDRPELGVKNGA